MPGGSPQDLLTLARHFAESKHVGLQRLYASWFEKQLVSQLPRPAQEVMLTLPLGAQQGTRIQSILDPAHEVAPWLHLIIFW